MNMIDNPYLDAVYTVYVVVDKLGVNLALWEHR